MHLIRAKVRPPNPLFGDLWRNLADYLARRDTSELTINEKAKNYGSLVTELKSRLKEAPADSVVDRVPLEITDAAVAMAADGYGEAKVEGRTASGDKRTVRTRDSALSFTIHQDATNAEIAAKALREAVRVNNERKLRHA